MASWIAVFSVADCLMEPNASLHDVFNNELPQDVQRMRNFAVDKWVPSEGCQMKQFVTQAADKNLKFEIRSRGKCADYVVLLLNFGRAITRCYVP